MNSLTVNLHLLMVSFYRPAGARTRIVIEDSAFPSDSYAVRSQARFHGLDPDTTVVRLTPRAGEDTLRTEDVTDFLARRGRHRRAGAARRGQLPHRRADGHPGDHRAGRADGRDRRLGPGARGGQRAAGAARVGRRLRRLVLVQVPQLRAGRAGRRLRPRAAPGRPATCRASRAGGAPSRRPGSRWRRSPGRRPRPRRGRSPTRRSSRWARCAPRWSSSTRSACRRCASAACG